MSETEPQQPLIKPDGGAFTEADLAEVIGRLTDQGDDGRTSFRDVNAAAIAHDESPRMLVAAGPGTGKSHLFFTRIESWSHRFPDQPILVSTFVRRLVADLDAELRASGLRKSRDEAITVATLHRLARSVVERNRGTSASPRSEHVEMIGPEWQSMVWMDVEMRAGLPADFRQFQSHFHELSFPNEESWQQIRAVYEELCSFYNAVGFADSIVLAFTALQENPTLQEDALWIFDEFQDFNLAEERFVAECTRQAGSILLAGDDDQAIYQDMKASHPDIIRSYYVDDAFANAMLPLCGRSSFHICMAAARFLRARGSAERINKVFMPLRQEPECSKVQVVYATSAATAAKYVERFIEAHHEDLTGRKEAILESVQKEPFLLLLSYSRDITAYMGDDGRSILQRIEEWQLEDSGPGPDYLRVRDYYRHDRYPQNNFTLRKVLQHNSVGAETVRDLISEALGSRETLRDVEQTPIADAAETSKLVSEIVTSADQPVERQAALLTNIVLVTDAGRLAADLEAFPLVPMAGQDDFLAMSERASPVEFSTISGSKGLSADHVIILGADNINMSGVSPEVFYVGITRARESLHLIQAWGARGAREHHEYVMALPEEHCDYVKHDTAGVRSYDNRDAMLEALSKRDRAARRRR